LLLFETGYEKNREYKIHRFKGVVMELAAEEHPGNAGYVNIPFMKSMSETSSVLHWLKSAARYLCYCPVRELRAEIRSVHFGPAMVTIGSASWPGMIRNLSHNGAALSLFGRPEVESGHTAEIWLSTPAGEKTFSAAVQWIDQKDHDCDIGIQCAEHDTLAPLCDSFC
jgi:hypothetical protein